MGILMAKKPKNQHYVDNAKFLETLIQYKARVQRAADAGDPKPRIDEYLGECFLKIATHLSYRPNFINYMYKDDMIADGYENCVQYIDNFNPEKSRNPFAYFTQIVYYAFLRRIAKEKRQQAIREKIVEKSGFDQVFHTDDNSDAATYNGIKSRIEMNNRY
jgi:hypothetical protein|tara:strand:+ start:209 stop:691 length:483 start_codon:yes stop_codon:yes gene_type:complete